MIRRPPRSTLFPYTTLFRSARRGDRPLCILDLAVPRDVEPAVGQLENVFLYDVDDLQARSEEHTSELQSRLHLVCRLLLEKKKKRQEQVGVDNKYALNANCM